MGSVAYRLDLPTEFRGIHDIFHVSSLKKSFKEQIKVIIGVEDISLRPNLTYEELLIQIMDC